MPRGCLGGSRKEESTLRPCLGHVTPLYSGNEGFVALLFRDCCGVAEPVWPGLKALGFALSAKRGNAVGGAGARFGLTRHAPSREPATGPNGKPPGRNCLRTGDASNANWANFLRRNWKGCSYLDTEHQDIEAGDGERSASCIVGSVRQSQCPPNCPAVYYHTPRPITLWVVSATACNSSKSCPSGDASSSSGTSPKSFSARYVKKRR